MGGTDRRAGMPGRVHEATEATPLMAAYFYGALRDQSARATAFQRRLRDERLGRTTLAVLEVAVAEAHRLAALPTLPALTTLEELEGLGTHDARLRPRPVVPAPRQVAAG